MNMDIKIFVIIDKPDAKKLLDKLEELQKEGFTGKLGKTLEKWAIKEPNYAKNKKARR